MIKNRTEMLTDAPRVPMLLGGLIHRAVPCVLNLASAPFNGKAIFAGRQKLEAFEPQLLNLGKAIPAKRDKKIPPVFHFVFGLKQAEEFPFYAKLAVLTALHHNPGWQAIFHFTYEPFGEHWESLKPKLVLSQVPEFDYFGIAPIRHYAHKADVIRLLALLHLGGAYLDIDTITQRPFAELQHFPFVMGIQAGLPGQPGGLCNAIMLAEPQSAFAKLWLTQYRYFRSRGQDWLWDFLSVKTPAQLARRNPDLLAVLRPQAFFDPLWNTVEEVMFAEVPKQAGDHSTNFAFHLWNNFIGKRLRELDETHVMNSNSLYAQIARPVLLALKRTSMQDHSAIARKYYM